MRTLLLILVAAGACERHKTAPAEDDRAGYVHHINDDLDHGIQVFDTEADTVREICNRRSDITYCSSALPRLPPPMKRP